MVVKVLQENDSKSQGEIVVVPGAGMCLVCDDACLRNAAELKSWHAEVRSAAGTTKLMSAPRLKAQLSQKPDGHTYLALDTNGVAMAELKVF